MDSALLQHSKLLCLNEAGDLQHGPFDCFVARSVAESSINTVLGRDAWR